MDIDDSLGFLLNRSATDMRAALENHLAPYGLTAPQWAVMARVSHTPGIGMTELASQLGYDKPTTSGIVSRLEKRELILRRRSNFDQRAIELYLSDAGKTLFAALPALAQHVNARAAQGFNEGEILLLKELLRRIRQNFA
ncbi:MarR family winged helix-turn-helix transcriptional regulator [Vogesella fluminis]|uniref:Transcriptional regulator n=1 Tax=Vogesella fluminis TaxID=1069161 RepID=A0ABQ3HDH9_9NEIS|nr:MarR family transcriptional regulator [Vogesella fluminis]GHD81320.1 transcriptional regulator [Vogesella fluminis]